MTNIILIAHNIRSAHNVGSIFRTAEGFGVKKIILSGYTPYPDLSLNQSDPNCAYDDELATRVAPLITKRKPTEPLDSRLPHIREKLTLQIHKTALGAESLVPFEYQETPDLGTLAAAGYHLVALEQDPRASVLSEYTPSNSIALVLGEEVEGIPTELLEQCDDIVEIPMVGQKESFNVSVATGIALYALTTNTSSQ